MSENTIEIGTVVAIEDVEGIWEVTANDKGWLTCQRDDETKKVRPSAVEVLDTDDEDEEDVGKKMAATLNAFKPNYVDTVAYSGAKSLNNGDRVAKLLAGLTPEIVCGIADAVCGEEPGFHAAKYEHLNPGQRRMNSGNRIRAHAKKGDAEMDDVVKACEAVGIKEAA